ncbi:MAG TPA: type IV pili methyl-accepting chemotaxis transducer N-terminal domain-containing protein [Noviherbaspirillum sp.]|uniref:type IV pili methyl-accepting chemotaxis transducer N-terminal domain-containing protein n=1 Tax=Noviherbaspirillum sp. TaxID=1926288 RepID=UPI002B4A210B|nr:type IV pili methyl-accepting chemotaxis transducer N-terminal domain-containing protein [Noviherbaspirillum sp.]HJV85085.1 type IV pili methyl-accepting chemotaxis transducer N-terminal domain-containing protein [Noviherbaspirillum sp.]
MQAMTLETNLPTWQRLSTKIVGALLGFLFLALIAIGATLLLSWQLEGSSAAINETGTLRMHNYRLSTFLARLVHEPGMQSMTLATETELKAIDDTFERLRRGDPQRPLLLPPTTRIQKGFQATHERWMKQMRPMAADVLQQEGQARIAAWRKYQASVDPFVAEIDSLVQLIERDSELRTFWLRSSQLALVAMALSGTVVLIYLMFLLIIEPIDRLRVGIQRMTQKDFGVRLQVESNDEFGQLTRGFNHMADRLEELYGSLEQRVQAKTAALADQNRELALLYDSAAFLQRPQTLESMCDGFLQRITQYFGAAGGSVRVLDEKHGNLHMVVHHGISSHLAVSEQCMKVGDCLCGEAVAKRISLVRDLRVASKSRNLPCAKEGFATISIFHIHAHEQHLGFFNLHFRDPKAFSQKEQALLETLGQVLGIAIENLRLATREREMAISEERNLVAQGLHDSIAQGLTFMNIQIQMLDDSLRTGNTAEAAEIVPALRSGVQESYEDVRELLLNFRSRLAEDDLIGALKTTIEKFRKQTGIDAQFIAEGNGPPFSREQQLQMLFIVQEALSNVRKHAMARHVEVRLHNHQDFALSIRDDGIGFQFDSLHQKGENHVGINIMRERAQRIHASLAVSSEIGKGTTVSLQLPQEERRAA